jgi:formiminotetrahydrofolate cyclodeaminase
MTGFADIPLGELAERLSSPDPTPGAGPSAAWTCAFAAALVEMVCGVALRHEPADRAAVEARRERARAVRSEALVLADRDAEAYGAVLEARGTARFREALSDAADPPLAIARLAGEVARLAADAAAEARGGVRGEAIAAAGLAEAVVRIVVPVVDLNLGGVRDDPRRAVAAELARDAAADLARANAPQARRPQADTSGGV